MKKLSIFLLFLCLLGIKEVYSATITDQITSTFLGDYHYVYSDGKFGDFELLEKIVIKILLIVLSLVFQDIREIILGTMVYLMPNLL